MEEGEERIRQAYGNAKWERLRAVKAQYDPDNFFRLNQNIPPAAPGAPIPRAPHPLEASAETDTV
jgi:hypothetical protein